MARSSNKPQETQMDIVAGNIAGLMQRKHITPDEICQVLGYAQVRTLTTRLEDTSLFTGADLNHLCIFFGVTLEQLAHDGMGEKESVILKK